MPSQPLENAGSSALYKGSTRVRTVEVHVGDILATTWTSSGITTDGFESIDLFGFSGQYLTVMSLGDDLQWLSIVEVRWATLQQLRSRSTGKLGSFSATGLRHRSRPSRYRTIPVCDTATIQSSQKPSGFVPTWFVMVCRAAKRGWVQPSTSAWQLLHVNASGKDKSCFVTAPLSGTGTNPTWFFSVAIPTRSYRERTSFRLI